MVRIRLRRVGSAHQPSYRIVVADSESPRDGRFIEIIGSYNPLTNPATVEMKDDRAAYWLSRGAQPSDAVERMLQKRGVYDKVKELRAAAKAPAAAEPAPVAAAPELPAPEAAPELPAPEAAPELPAPTPETTA